MSFKIIKAGTRTANMLAWLTGTCKVITDLIPGSLTRTKIEAIAVEMEEQDHQFERALRKAIPVSIYKAFQFDLLPAVKASGYITFTATVAPAADIIIKAKTRVATVGTALKLETVFETVDDATLLAGQTTVDVKVTCMQAGTVGNVPAGTIVVMKSAISGIASVSNVNSFSNGSEVETEAERQQRFNGYIKTLTRGTGAALEFGALQAILYDIDGNITEQVVEAFESTTSPTQTPGVPGGFSDLFVYSGSGGASAALITEAQKIIDGYEDNGTRIPGYKASGVQVSVLPVLEHAEDVTVSVVLDSGYNITDVSSAISSAIEAYITQLAIGEKLVYNELVRLVMAVEGVYNAVFSVPTADVERSQVIAPTFDGVGLNDMTSGGTYSGTEKSIYYVVEIDASGLPDTFKWGRSNASGLVFSWQEETVQIPAGSYALSDGVTISFGSINAHTIGDKWIFRADRGVTLAPGTITISEA